MKPCKITAENPATGGVNGIELLEPLKAVGHELFAVGLTGRGLERTKVRDVRLQ